MTLDDFWEFITTQCYMEKIGENFVWLSSKSFIRELKLNELFDMEYELNINKFHKLNEIVLKYDPNKKYLEIKRFSDVFDITNLNCNNIELNDFLVSRILDEYGFQIKELFIL